MEKSSQIDDFWEKYLAAVLSRSIPEARAEWYLKWAQRFAVSAAGPLRSRSAEQIKAFLDGLASQPGIRQWQITQASDSLKILYQDMLNCEWTNPEATSAGRSDDAPVSHVENVLSVSVTRNSPEPFRDAAPSKEIDCLHGDILQRLRSEIRLRHYSLRTEQSYEQWVRRFIAFHELKSPEELSAAAVKEYLTAGISLMASERSISGRPSRGNIRMPQRNGVGNMYSQASGFRQTPAPRK